MLTISVCYSQEIQKQLTGELFVHDPVMIKQDSVYYVFHTGPGVTIRRSFDGLHWEDYGSIFKEGTFPAWHREEIPEQDRHLWAPDIIYKDEKYHCYYSVSAWINFNSSIGYASNTTLDTTDANYKWVDHGIVISYRNGGEGVNVIDPQVYVEGNGNTWLFYGSFQKGLRLVQLDPKIGMLLNEKPELTTITTHLGEGVFVIKSGEHYYIFASRGKCCKGINSTYHVVMGRSKKLEGPYLNKEGNSWVDNHFSMFMEGNEDAPGRGHNGFFTENDTTYIVYHAYSRAHEGRQQLGIQPVFMDNEGWPTLDSSFPLFERGR